MRIKALCLAATAMVLSKPLVGQQAPTKEFGVDMSVASIGFDGGGDRILSIDTPVDVRMGFMIQSPVAFETRFGLSFITDGDGSLLRASPALNAVLGMNRTARHLGPYFTGGVLMDLAHFSGSGSSETETQLGVNVGVGTRIEWGTSSAFRTELFLTKKFEKGDRDLISSDYVAGSTAFGLRFGLSFFN